MNKFKGIAMVQLQEGSIVLLWHDMWNSSIKSLHSAELFSDTTQSNITVQQAKEMENLHDMFQLPMSNEAFQQYLNLMEELANLPETQDKDVWTYIWGNSSFTVNKAYQALTGHTPTHPVFNWLWKSK
jgi:urate oxidase